jgi:hypothetical protein
VDCLTPEVSYSKLQLNEYNHLRLLINIFLLTSNSCVTSLATCFGVRVVPFLIPFSMMGQAVKHNIMIQIHINIMWDWHYFVEYSSYSHQMWEIFYSLTWMWGIFYIILSVSHNNDMDLNNVMTWNPCTKVLIMKAWTKMPKWHNQKAVETNIIHIHISVM